MTYLIDSGEILKVCRSVAKNLSDDLYQEVILILLEMAEEKILKAYNEGYLRPLFLKIIYIQFNKPTAPFYRMYRNNRSEDIDMIDIPNQEEQDTSDTDQKINYILEYFKKEPESSREWYKKNLLKLSIEMGAPELARQSGISLGTVIKQREKFKKELKDNYGK